MADKIKCRNCGKESESLKSYISKTGMQRATVCDSCAVSHKLNNEDKFYIIPYSEVTNHIRPKAGHA